MEIIGCGRGHFYNPNEYSSCPQCAKENAGGGDVLGVTEPVDFGKYAGNFGSGDAVSFDSFASGGALGVTEPVSGFAGGSVSEIGATEPIDGFGGQGSMMMTEDFKESYGGGSKVQDYAPTAPVSMAVGTDSYAGKPFLPVVGWLVCIEGAAKGRDYRIHSQYNYIGRGQHMDICISGDDCISAEKAAILAYDDQEKFFSFGPGMGHNVVRVNGKMLMNAVALEAYDVLTIGKTKLLFVPLCGERFDWNDK